MTEHSWLDYWGIKYNPFLDFPVGSREYRQYMVTTRSIDKIRPEVQTIANSPVGVIKLVVGSKGSGKTSWLSSLFYDLSAVKVVFPVYVNMFRSLSAIRDVGSSVFLERYLLNDIVFEILSKLRTVAPAAFQKHLWLEGVAKNVITMPMAKIQPNISSENLFNILKEISGEGYSTFVIAIDELDKLMEPGDPGFEKNVAMICDFFGTQQGLFQKLAMENRVSIFVSCDERLVDPLEKRNLTYLGSRITVERLTVDEARRILECRLKHHTETFSFSDKCVERLVSYFQGNARSIILACEPLMREAAVRGLKTIDEKLVGQLFPKAATESFEKDFLDLTAIEASSAGAKMLWRLCSRLPRPEQRKQALVFITGLYAGVNEQSPSAIVFDLLKDLEFVVYHAGKGEKAKIDQRLTTFLDQWTKRGHQLQDFVEWYSNTPLEPRELEEIDSKIHSLVDEIVDENIRGLLLSSYDIYAYSLDSLVEDQAIIRESWKMLEQAIRAFCMETGFRDFVLSISENKADKHPSPHIRERTSLMQLLSASLNKKGVRLACYENAKAVKALRNAVIFERQIPAHEQIDVARVGAKLAFKELVSKWNVGMKVTGSGQQKKQIPDHIEMHPDKPFTNMQNIFELIKTLKGCVLILDKHLDRDAFKFFMHLSPSRVDKLQILGSRAHLSSALKEEYKAFRKEIQNMGISSEFRIMDDKDAAAVHDRYLLSDDKVYNTPPWNVIHEKLGDIVLERGQGSKKGIFNLYWSRAMDISKVKIE